MQLNQGQMAKAIKVLQLNIAMCPNEYSTYQSLGEAFMNAGNKKLAIKNYEKTLQLNPANVKAAKILEQLKTN